MALTREQKNQVVATVSELLASSKLTVVAQYQGTGVKQMQELRRSAKDSQTVVKVVKNRLVRQAILATDSVKEVDTSALTGQLLYAFNSAEDVKSLASLPSKDQLRAQLVGTLNAPLSGFVSVLNGNLRGFLTVLSAKAEQG